MDLGDLDLDALESINHDYETSCITIKIIETVSMIKLLHEV